MSGVCRSFHPRHPGASPLFRLAALAAWVLAVAVVQAQQYAPTPPPGRPAPMQQGAQLVGRPGAQFQIAGDEFETQFTGPMTSRGPGFSAKSGLQLRIDASSPGQYGYRAVVFTVKQSAAATADKRITARFWSGDWPTKGRSIAAEQSFTLAQGSTTGSTQLLVPQYEDWQLCGWEVLVDGRTDPDLGLEMMNYPQTGRAGGMTLAMLGLSDEQRQRIEGSLQLAFSGNTVSFRNVAAGDLPVNWLEHTSLDGFIMPAAELTDLVRQHPEQAQTLLRWVRAGGNLWLVHAGRQWERLPEVERALDVTPHQLTESDEANADEFVLARGWRFAPLGERAADPAEAALLLSGYETESLASGRESRGIQGGTSRRAFAVRGLGMGLVAAFRTDQLDAFSPGDDLTPTAITQSILAPRLMWTFRHGNQPDDDNAEFNNLLVPNVGVAPVGQFQFLITLFVLAIGPLNYWMLKRRGKLPLLLATVPTAAAVTTLLLFSYGLLADGVKVRVRARSFTKLDQRLQEAVSWTRLSYYAGVAPREGLVMPKDAAVYPVLPRWAVGRRWGGRSGPSRELTWTDEQRLAEGWLMSRTPTQYLAIAARPSAKRLEMRATETGLRVTNRLGADVTHLAVQDHQGQTYWCENLADGDRRIFPPAEQRTISIKLRQIFTANIPEFPAGYDDTRYSGQYYGSMLSQNLMEGQLEAITSPLVRSWGDGTYLAFTSRGVEIAPGVEGATEEASFHVIRGTW